MNRFTSRLLALVGLLTVEVVLGAGAVCGGFCGVFLPGAGGVRASFRGARQLGLGHGGWLAAGLPGPHRAGAVRYVFCGAAVFAAGQHHRRRCCCAGPATRARPGSCCWPWPAACCSTSCSNSTSTAPGPANALLHTFGLSFPSGHAMLGLTFYGCLAWLLARHFRPAGLGGAAAAVGGADWPHAGVPARALRHRCAGRLCGRRGLAGGCSGRPAAVLERRRSSDGRIRKTW